MIKFSTYIQEGTQDVLLAEEKDGKNVHLE